MKWYSIDEFFLDYLREFESRIPRIVYGDDKFKPFFGALFEIGDLIYVTQVSHPQNRHKQMKDNSDFVKLYDGKRLMAVVNLNYMFPVPKSLLIVVDYANIESFRTFNNEFDKNNYITLLKRELREIKIKKIAQKAQDLYTHKYTFPDDVVSKRCIEFKDIEIKCHEYSISDYMDSL